jgi:hypothetical protein
MDRQRLARLLGMCGSSHDGEVVNAARLAIQMLKKASMSWEEVLIPPVNGHDESVAIDAARVLLAENEQLRNEVEDLREQLRRSCARSLQTPDHWKEPSTTLEKIEQALEWTTVLSDWARTFTTSIAGRWRLNPKQQDHLDQIAWKIERIARARGIAL